MVWRKLLLSGLTLGVIAGSASAGIFFNRNRVSQPTRPTETRPDEQQVNELMRILRSDPDERRRASAAAELGKIDLRANPSAGHALIEALEQDPSVHVRAEVASALGKLRPLTLQVGKALETALNNDQSPRVRLTARNSLLPFIQSGYRLAGAKADAYDPRPTPSVPVPNQPPVVQHQPQRSSPTRVMQPPITNRSQTTEPPLASTQPTEEPRPVLRPSTSMKPNVPADPRIADPFGPIIGTDADPTRRIGTPPPRPILPPSATQPSSGPTTQPSFGPTTQPSFGPTTPAKPAPTKSDDDGPILNPPG